MRRLACKSMLFRVTGSLFHVPSQAIDRFKQAYMHAGPRLDRNCESQQTGSLQLSRGQDRAAEDCLLGKATSVSVNLALPRSHTCMTIHPHELTCMWAPPGWHAACIWADL
eukprot:1160422-Pelagomonas_calceolata.AAC.13